MANRATTAKTLATGSMLSAVAAGAALMSGSVLAEESLEGALKASTAKLNLRPRYENVTQESLSSDDTTHSDALTLKTRLTFTTGSYHGVSALLEFDDVTSLKDVDYFDGTNGKDGPAIVDPEGTEVNQAYLAYTGLEHTEFKWGRQRILLDNQRFVGGVGWRQNEQTYDAFTVNYADSTYTLDYSYLWRVNRIFDGSGTSVQDQEFDSDSHILLATAKALGGKFSGFVYALDFKEPYVNGGSAGLPSITYGIGYAGAYKNVSYDLTYARQSDYGDNPVSYDANYVGIDTRLAVKPVTFTLGYELLGSDDGVKGFVTPLATLHKFQGWADIFLATPGDGIEDIYAGIGGSIGKVALGAFYHDFSSDEGSTDYGSEVDLVATYPINDNLNIQLKYADYSADDFAVDTEKLWFTVNLKF